MWSDDIQGLSKAKSFGCTFCKRGFSNAQALGGHMNIHRRDRAKLKEFSSQDIKKMDSADSPPASAIENVPKPASISPGEVESAVEPNENSETLRGLPLFAEAPMVSNDEGASGFDEHMESSRVVSHVSLQTEAVDLELRLGPEPEYDAAVKP